jgi:hypothetical protein
MQGKIINEKSGLGISGVTISTQDTNFKTISKNAGSYHFTIPKSIDILIFSHDDYKSKIVSLEKSNRVIKVKLQRIKPDSTDLPSLKNTLSFLPLKLLTGGFSLRLERFIKTRYSVGSYLTYYYRGRQFFGNEKFTGIKVSPYFRFYFKRNKSYGFYIQGAGIVAYFDFSRLKYNYSNSRTISAPTIFWTAGLSGAVGITNIVRNSKHFIIDINIGWQYLPPAFENNFTDENGIEYSHNSLWWVAGGPGSAIEIKLSIGGIF